MIESEKIQKLMQDFDSLPSMPGVAIELMEAIKKRDPDISHISRLISSDAALAAKILKLINSASYGLRIKVTSVDHAIRLLGLNTVKNLSLGLMLKTNFITKIPGSVNLSAFWKDSLVGAISAKMLSERLKIKTAEDAFFLGLLKDIGSLTLAHMFPEQYFLVHSETITKKISSHTAENKVFGFDHADIGALLIKAWGLPETFYIPIQYHHSVESLPKSCSSDIRVRSAILHLSSLYIELIKGVNIPEVLCHITHYVKDYGFQDSIDSAKIGMEVIKQIKEMSPIFDIEFRDESDLESLIESAKSELLNISMQMIGEMIGKSNELESLRQQANKDAMTQISNYKAFCEALNREISRALRYRHELSQLMADIDFFKSVNDRYGHPAGDQVLKTVARTLEKELRDCDFVARYGGEEFAIILPETKLKDAFVVAERLREKIKAMEILYEGKRIKITMSFGVAGLKHTPPMAFNELVKSADKALYDAKMQGRDRCCYV
jgi:diguanylate cyclase (GGDEF)-like protein